MSEKGSGPDFFLDGEFSYDACGNWRKWQRRFGATGQVRARKASKNPANHAGFRQVSLDSCSLRVIGRGELISKRAHDV